MTECLKLKRSNCKNCYKCIRHCPVKSIRFSANQANIVPEECILCGRCFVVCPQNAKQIADDTERVRVMIQSGQPVYASLAPSFVANYDGVGIESMKKALKALGFADAEETAIGAAAVKTEYERMLDTGAHDVLISSCCHSVNLLIQKHYPGALAYLANVATPMHAHCLDLKKRYEGAKTVFIGPCVAKKDEAQKSGGVVDAVLTFEELTRWLEAEKITLAPVSDREEKSKTRLFPTAGGIIDTMKRNPNYTYITVDGPEKCIAALEDIVTGRLHKCFIEMSMCTGSCIGGPVMEKYHNSPMRDYVAVHDYAGSEDFDLPKLDAEEMRGNVEYIERKRVLATPEQITEILRRMGKTRPEDELNCGSCGYDTCRAKAQAIFEGKADVSMCLPYLKERAESFSDNIIKNTPNAVVVLNEELEVQQINVAARKIMNIRSASDVLGEPVIRILDPKVFMEVKKTGRGIAERRTYLVEYDKYVEQTVMYDREYKILILIMRDVTDEELAHRRKEEISRQTVDTADRVVEKQMRIVQQIASLLGETAAETKIALAQLKESIQDE
jgi:iron only hydrogenase large subunit-like protein/uncharacterized Fe-S cluster-containing protein